jgi:hypothetical protein
MQAGKGGATAAEQLPAGMVQEGLITGVAC